MIVTLLHLQELALAMEDIQLHQVRSLCSSFRGKSGAHIECRPIHLLRITHFRTQLYIQDYIYPLWLTHCMSSLSFFGHTNLFILIDAEAKAVRSGKTIRAPSGPPPSTLRPSAMPEDDVSSISSFFALFSLCEALTDWGLCIHRWIHQGWLLRERQAVHVFLLNKEKLWWSADKKAWKEVCVWN